MSLQQVMFVNRRDAEQAMGLSPAWRGWAIISISGLDPAHLKEGWQAVLRLEFDDVDPDPKTMLAEEPYVLFSSDHAHQIIEFVSQCNADESLVGILVHCHAGISRSAAVAKWIAEQYEISFPPTYMLYNKHVYSTLRRVSLGE